MVINQTTAGQMLMSLVEVNTTKFTPKRVEKEDVAKDIVGVNNQNHA